MKPKPILVIGATGKTGARVLARLTAAGVPTRAGSRRGPVPFDWDEPATWAPALDGIGAVYATYHPDFAYPGAIENLGRRVDFTPISFQDFHAELERASGTLFADMVTAIARETFDGRNAHVSGDVLAVLGRSPRDFTEFALAAAGVGKWARVA